MLNPLPFLDFFQCLYNFTKEEYLDCSRMPLCVCWCENEDTF